MKNISIVVNAAEAVNLFNSLKIRGCRVIQNRHVDAARQQLVVAVPDTGFTWTRGENGGVRLEPIGNIPTVIGHFQDEANPRCPECNRYNAMLPQYGVNNLVVCRDCCYLARLVEVAEAACS